MAVLHTGLRVERVLLHVYVVQPEISMMFLERTVLIVFTLILVVLAIIFITHQVTLRSGNMVTNHNNSRNKQTSNPKVSYHRSIHFTKAIKTK